tara:strand:+ start:259 stop:483 length:225 start_codon:yes stop_codon:yes gene_type:complete
MCNQDFKHYGDKLKFLIQKNDKPRKYYYNKLGLSQPTFLRKLNNVEQFKFGELVSLLKLLNVNFIDFISKPITL